MTLDFSDIEAGKDEPFEDYLERFADPEDGPVVELNESEWDALISYLSHIDAWNKEHTLRNRKVATKQWFEFIQEVSENTVFEATTSDARQFMTILKREGYASRSIRNKLYDVSAMYGYWEDEDGIPVDEHPIRGKDTIQDMTQNMDSTLLADSRDKGYMEPEEYQKLRDACENVRDLLVIDLLWATGVRASEAVKIKLGDINHEHNQIEVENAKRGEDVDEDDKYRYVYYGHTFRNTLNKWENGGYRDRYSHAQESDYLLLTKDNHQMHVNRVNEIVDEVATAAGMQETLHETVDGRSRNKYNAHFFRKSYGVMRVKSEYGGGSMPLPFLQRLMGHQDISVTRDKYLNFLEDDVQEAERKFAPAY